MYKIFTKIKQENILNEQVKQFLTLIEFTFFILAVDIILPVKNEFNYYFPLYFLNPVLYIEMVKINNYTTSENNENYINATLNSVKESNNIIFFVVDKYIKKLPPTLKSFSYYENYLIFIAFIIFILLLLGFAFLFAVDEKNSKNSTMKNKYFMLINVISIKINYIFLKPFIFFFFL